MFLVFIADSGITEGFGSVEDIRGDELSLNVKSRVLSLDLSEATFVYSEPREALPLSKPFAERRYVCLLEVRLPDNVERVLLFELRED